MKLTSKQLKQMIAEELKATTESWKPDPGQPGGGEDIRLPEYPGDEPEGFESMEKDFVLNLMHHLINGETGLPFTPEEIAAMDPSAVGDLASQIRQALRSKGAKRIPPLSDPGAFDPFTGQ